jgi:hypothetical protein
MRNHNATVIIYIKQPVEQRKVKQLSKIVDGMHGVIGTKISKMAKSFFSVDYDPYATDSRNILDHVRNQGYSAVLVGM